MGGGHAQAVMTDVLFNVPIAGNVSGLGKVKHKDFVAGCGEWSEEEFFTFLVTVFSLARDVSVEGAAIGSFIDWRSVELLIRAGKAADLTLINLAVWAKSPGMGAFLRSAHELYPIFCNGAQLGCNNVMLGKSGRDRSN
ncbi:MAG TPA: DNA methylase N-4, partial [Ochrobactrum sp.]|nr:DNA methylase N-4 [Ochrobactrum sp.]